MKEILGIDINFDIAQLIKVTDLISFDGPLLSHFMNDKGDNYLFYWVDVNETHNRWMFFRVDISRIQSYLEKRETLYSLIVNGNDSFVYFVDIDNNLNYQNIKLIPTKMIIEEYLPEKESFFEFEVTDDFDIAAISQKHNSGILEIRIKGDAIKYGSIPLTKLAPIIPKIEDIRKSLASPFIKERRKKIKNKEGKSKDEKSSLVKMLKQETQYEYVYSLAGSFRMILKPIEQQTALPEVKTFSDEFAGEMIKLFGSGFDVKTIETMSEQYNKSLINKYNDFMLFMNENKLGLSIGWHNNQSKITLSTSIKPKDTTQILKNLSNFKFRNKEEISYRGKFFALNIRTGSYSFESIEGDDFRSIGFLDQNQRQMAFDISFNKEYDVIIAREIVEHIGRKEKVKDTIISFIEVKES